MELNQSPSASARTCPAPFATTKPNPAVLEPVKLKPSNDGAYTSKCDLLTVLSVNARLKQRVSPSFIVPGILIEMIVIKLHVS